MHTGQSPQIGSPLLVVALGTSFTSRGDWSSLAAELEVVHRRPVRFVNAGKGGANSRYGARTMSSLAELRPDFVLIEFAINDADVRSAMSPSESGRNMRAIFGEFQSKSPEGRLFNVLTPRPRGPKGWMRPFLPMYDERHASTARDMGVTVVDTRFALRSLTDREKRLLQPDGLHLTRQGFARVAAPRIVSAITELPNKPIVD